ncbi:hypothetical protein [Hespellia stercorisuis]|uniref:Uncharacterized protein n=1 Tax=Hespellia stercorisuis DSM 15480 TaxID=1121950 RepID=A0A1M6L8Z5_9FIRM|nr:hypothetical protein [Hespellia stercorisuis]SHJ67681.1 hypothetical protein SAMN02745243_01107 [Hespellia stercorisuis DSM 15480]
MKTAFTDQESGKMELLELLKEKYNCEFVMVKNEKYNKQGLINSYSCIAAPKENVNQEFNAVVTSNGQLKDDFSLWLFWNDLIKKGELLIENGDDIETYKVIPEMGVSEKKWDLQCSLNQFIQESNAYLILEIQLKDTIMESEYVNTIETILQKMYNQDISLEVRIDSSDGNIFWQTISPNMEPFSDEYIRDAIETAIDSRF